MKKVDYTKVTPFQARVYETIRWDDLRIQEGENWRCSGEIPAGRVSTYGGVAKALNSSARAVGGALRRNPFAPTVPCHRVVMGDLSIGGFSGSFGECEDTRRKKKMLENEGVRFVEGKVDGDAFIHVFGDMSLFEVTGEHDARKACNTKRPKIVPRTDNHRAAKRTRRTTRA